MLIKSRFSATGLLKHSHFSTIYPLLKGPVPVGQMVRETLSLNDGDFLDIDYLRAGYDKVLVLAHGLEGSSRRNYILQMAQFFHQKGFDICALNFRGCSGVPNLTARMYHSGEIEDFTQLIQYLDKIYSKIYLAGFSMGGNITLKFLGVSAERLPKSIQKAAVFSVPVHLGDCSERLGSGINKIYTEYFLKSLRMKVLQLEQKNPHFALPEVKKIKSLHQFDSLVTAPMFRFQSAEDYYQQASSIFHLEKIEIETLLVNALNDPFLGKKCFPADIAKRHSRLLLELPQHGGHVGFYSDLNSKIPWFVQRAYEFLSD